MRNKFYSYSQDYINRWIISYADFVTMLLAVFMVMYALAQMHTNPLTGLQSSVKKIFDKSSTNQAFPDYKKIDLLSEKRELLKVFSTTNAKVESRTVDISDQKQQIYDLKSQINGIEAQITKEAVEFKNIQNQIRQNLGNTAGLSFTRETRGLIIRLNDAVLFTSGSDIIKDKARITLDKLAGVLSEIPNPIRIEGHTDNRPIKSGKFPSNWELSTARATNIINYLVNDYGFHSERLSAVGYGEFMPIETNKTEEGRAANRRVDIVVLSSASNIFNPETKNIYKEKLER